MEDNFLKVAKQAAEAAKKVLLKYYGKNLKRKVKFNDSSNFATQADLEAEKIIVKILTKNFPKHNIIAEENARINNQSDYTWVIDPLDGTVAFTAGIPTFGISVGLLKKKQPFLGVINHVALNNLYWAKKNTGAYLNGQPISVTKTKNLGAANLGLDFGYRQSRRQKLTDIYVEPLISQIRYAYCFGSSVTTQALVAQGVLDGYVNSALLWDFVAGAVLVEEAGGRVTDFEGKSLDWTQEELSVVASNGLIHEQILEVLR